jgi:predicted transcriptional regulator
MVAPDEEPDRRGAKLERAVVLLLLGVEGGECSSCAELAREIGVGMAAVREAVGRLRELGVIEGSEHQLSASRAARYLDELGLIGI